MRNVIAEIVICPVEKQARRQKREFDEVGGCAKILSFVGVKYLERMHPCKSGKDVRNNCGIGKSNFLRRMAICSEYYFVDQQVVNGASLISRGENQGTRIQVRFPD